MSLSFRIHLLILCMFFSMYTVVNASIWTCVYVCLCGCLIACGIHLRFLCTFFSMYAVVSAYMWTRMPVYTRVEEFMPENPCHHSYAYSCKIPHWTDRDTFIFVRSCPFRLVLVNGLIRACALSKGFQRYERKRHGGKSIKKTWKGGWGEDVKKSSLNQHAREGRKK